VLIPILDQRSTGEDRYVAVFPSDFDGVSIDPLNDTATRPSSDGLSERLDMSALA
jgi:hypothetical protein